MILRATHRTRYTYGSPSSGSHNEVRLKPLTDSSQTCRSFLLEVTPRAPIYTFEEIGGTVHHFTVNEPHTELDILATTEVETKLSDPFQDLNLIHDDWSYLDSRNTQDRYAEFLAPSPYIRPTEGAMALATSVRAETTGGIASFLLNLNRCIYESFAYDPDVTHVHSTIEEVLELRAGVCQDFAHLMIGCCRSIGLPARYVSGYLYSQRGSGIRGHEAMHAWLECPMADGRWLAVDPTNNLLANDLYIRVHVGRDYSEVSPTRGIYIGTPAKSLDVSVNVERVGERAVAS